MHNYQISVLEVVVCFLLHTCNVGRSHYSHWVLCSCPEIPAGQAGLTAGSILQVRSLHVSGKERRLPCTNTSRCPLLPTSPGPEGEGQVIHMFSQHPAPSPTLWALDGKTSNPALSKD